MFRKQDDYTPEMIEQIDQKLASFYEQIRGKNILIAFTGGLKSTMLAELSRPVVQKMKCIFVETAYTSPQDLFYVNEFQKSEDNADVETEIIQDFELNQNILVLNSEERDFFCKKGIADLILEKQSEENYDIVLDGTDSEQFQSFWASKQQFGDLYNMIFGGLGISREDLLYLAKKHGFKLKKHPEINLITRFTHNLPITGELLQAVVEMEQFIKDLINIHLVRVRILDPDHIIIEVKMKAIGKLLDEKTRKKIFTKFSEYGFSSINVDLAGYRRNNLVISKN
jgi:pyridinium-3,5-biscarboxylic acid mononucleotide sulfurtransferase